MERGFKAILAGVKVLVVTNFIALIVIVAAQVFWRYVFRDPIFWAEEFARILFVWLIMMSLIISYEEGSQATVEVFVKILFPTGKHALRIEKIIHWLVAVFCFFLVWKGVELTKFVYFQTFSALDVTYSIQYAAVPICSFFVVLVCIKRIFLPENKNPEL